MANIKTKPLRIKTAVKSTFPRVRQTASPPLLHSNKYRIVVWSDLHAHAWLAPNRPDRFDDFIGAIRTVYETALEVEANMVLFNGDLFESKNSHSSFVWTRVCKEIARGIASTPDAEHVFNTGNHDLYRGESVVSALEEMILTTTHSIKVAVDAPLYINDAPFNFAVVPYGYTEEPLWVTDEGVPFYNCVFTHTNIKGSNMGHGFKCQDDGLHEMWFDSTQLIVNGHMHVIQQFTREHGSTPDGCVVATVGPPIPINWVDTDEPTQASRGVLILDFEEGSPACLRREPFDWAARFYSSANKKAREQDFVRAALEKTGPEEFTAKTELLERRRLSALRGEKMLEEYVMRMHDEEDALELLEFGKKIYLGV